MPILKRVIGHASHMDRYYKTCPFCTRIQFSRYITNAICKSIEIRIPMVISNEKSWPPAAPSSSFLPLRTKQSVPLQIVDGKDKLKLNVTYVCTRMLPIYLTIQWTRTNINLFAAYRSDAPTRRMVPHFLEVDGIHGPVEAFFAP